MKSLQAIQKLSKIGKVLSEVIYIMSIVGFFLSIGNTILRVNYKMKLHLMKQEP